jgi:hypothetical protein
MDPVLVVVDSSVEDTVTVVPGELVTAKVPVLVVPYVIAPPVIVPPTFKSPPTPSPPVITAAPEEGLLDACVDATVKVVPVPFVTCKVPVFVLPYVMEPPVMDPPTFKFPTIPTPPPT